MNDFEPVSPAYGICDAMVEHRLRGGYRLTLRTRQLHGRLEAALAAPSPTDPARICTAHISAHTPTPATARILDAATRYAPALPDARDTRPPSPVLGGPWDAPSTARLTAAVLRELTEAEQLAGELAALLQPGRGGPCRTGGTPPPPSSCPPTAVPPQTTRPAAASPGHCARSNTRCAPAGLGLPETDLRRGRGRRPARHPSRWRRPPAWSARWSATAPAVRARWATPAPRSTPPTCPHPRTPPQPRRPTKPRRWISAPPT